MSSATSTPILKKNNIPLNISKSLNVSFDIPSENSDLVEYLKCMSLSDSCGKLNTFLKVLLSKDTEDEILLNWLKQLKDNISVLDKENERIVGTLLEMNWTFRSQEVNSIYHELILNLVSAHTYYLRPVLVMIIKIFTSDRWDCNRKVMAESGSYQKAHALLQDIVVLVPSAPEYLCQLLFLMFPYFRKPTHQILEYTVNVLNICSYLPLYRITIMEHLIDKFLQIDVHCPRDTIERWESERDEERDNRIIPNMDVEISIPEDMAYPLANTLDVIMKGFFNYIQCSCNSNNGELNWEATKKLYRELLTLFDKLILPTHRCCHVQFVMFYICSLRPALCEGFIDYLWKKVKNPTSAPVRREAASFYIGSLLARATYISISTVSVCLDLMCGWLHSYINNYDAVTSCDIGTHGPFYSVCQTVFYVFAFRHKEFIAMKNGSKYLRCLNFERIVTCRLNPLKFCQPTIVQNFASVARNYQIAYCYPVIERNNRSLMQSGITSSLTTFFPFDPYILKKSKIFIDNLYRLYVPQDEEELMEQEEEDSFYETNDGLFSYSSSPGFKQSHLMFLQR